MPEPLLTQLERRLITLRLPLARRQRALRELSEHREDLIEAAFADGLSESDAAIRADQSLGDPTELAAQIVLAARRSSRTGRHPVMAFCLLPFFGSVFAVLSAYAVVIGIFYYLAPSPNFNEDGIEAVLRTWYAQISICAHVAQLAVIAAMAWGFCKLAVRSVSKPHWMWIACLICSVQGYIWSIFISAHNLSIGYFNWPKALVPVENATIPIAIALFVDLRYRRLQFKRLSQAGTALALLTFIGSGCATQKPEPPPHTRAWLGGEYNVVKHTPRGPVFFPTPGVAYSTNYPGSLSQTKAIHVIALSTNSPAYLAGLRLNDFIVGLNNQKLKSLAQLRRALNKLPAESTVHLKAIRDNHPLDLTVQTGTEKYFNHGTFAIGFPGYVESWDLWPNPGFSLVFLGYEPYGNLRRDLKSGKELTTGKSRVWCALFEITSTDQIVAQERRAPGIACSFAQ